MAHITNSLLITYRETYYARWGEYMKFSDTLLDMTHIYYDNDGNVLSIDVFLESLLTVLHIDDFVYGYRQCTGKTLGCYLITNISEPYIDDTTDIPQVTLTIFNTNNKGCFIYG